MTQEICVAVPVQFGARTFVGEPSVTCEEATNQDVCSTCGENAANASTANTAIATSKSGCKRLGK